MIMKYSLHGLADTRHKLIGAVFALICVVAIVWGVLQSKKETPGLMDSDIE